METTVSSPRITRKERWPDARRTAAILLALVYGSFLLFAFSWSRCFFDGCPNVDTLAAFQPGGAPVLLDRNGEVFADLTPVERKVVPIFSLPSHVAQAFLAVEDKRFYEHRGIDWRRVGGAVVANLRAGGFDQGFSTITMQLARNVFPNRIPGEEQTTRRKLLEVRVAREIEEKYSKDEILELYLNHIYFGNRARGIEAAAHQYFGHSAQRLTLEEAAVLAALPKAPSHYDPRRHPEKALERRNLVISLMEEQGRLPWIQADAARKAPLRLAPAPRQAQVESGLAPWFVEQVRRELEETFGPALYTRPLRVVTSLDSRIQRAAEEELRRQLKLVESGELGRFEAPLYSALASPPEDGTRYLQGAVVMLEAKTGDVLAWVGGRNYAHSQFDRVSQARRQPGSAWKPFVYAAALREGFVLSQPLADTRISVKLPGGRVWRPQNFGNRYEGRVTMRDALVRSKNVPTVRLASAIGLGQVASVAREAGIEEETGIELPSMALGTVTVSPLELTGAYTAFANLGEAVAPRLVLRVEDESGRVLWESRPDREAALEPSVAFLITDVLAEALERGTGTQVRAAGVVAPAAGKTGTTNDGADTWFVGYTPDLVAGIWLGFDQPRPILKDATGGSLAAPVWGRIVQRVYQGGRKRPEPWKAPQGVVSRRVDPSTGLILEDGCAPRSGRPAKEELFVEGIEPAAYCPGKDALPRDPFPSVRMIAERKARETEEEAAEEARLAAIREAEEKKRREEADQARLAEQKRGEEENRLAEIAEARRRAAFDAREKRERELREEQTRLAEQKRREEEQKLAQAREKEEREKKALLAEQAKREEAERLARAEAEEKRRKEEAEKARLAEARELREREEKEKQTRLAQQKQREEAERIARAQAEEKRRKEEGAEKARLAEARELREREEKEKQTRLAQQKQREEAERLARTQAEEKRRKQEEAEKARLAEARELREREEKEKQTRLAQQKQREEEERIARAEAEEKRRKEEEAEEARLAEAKKRQEKERKERAARELREREERLAQAEAEADRREREIKSREEALRAGRSRREEPEEDEADRRDRIIREEERRAREDDEEAPIRDEERRAEPEDEEPEAVPAEDLSGWWEMTNTIQSTNYSAFKGLRLGYRVQLEQDGDRIVGRGQKWTENGRSIPSAGRTPITVRGRLEGRRVILTFTEQGAKRRTSGSFSWTLSADRTTLRGSFESDAANASGSSLARRMP